MGTAERSGVGRIDYAGMITRFYSSYPDDVKVPILKLLDAMSDSKHLTIQQNAPVLWGNEIDVKRPSLLKKRKTSEQQGA